MPVHWIAANPWRIHTRVLGPAVPATPPPIDVVLVHGLGMSGRYLVPTQQLLAEDFRVLAPDLPGYGRSTRPAHVLTLPELADALVAWLDAAGLDRVSLVGHSLGCQVAALVADRHPERVSKLVLASPSGDPGAGGPWGQMLRLLADAPREHPGLVPIAVVDYLRARPPRMWTTLRESMTAEATGRLHLPRQPTLVVRGEHDPVASADWVQRLTELLPDGFLATVPGAAHGLVYTSPEATVAAIGPFLAAGS